MPYDADSQAYFDRVTSAGGAITTGEKDAADAYILRLKDASIGSPWSQMVELWEKLCLDEVAALVKIKTASTDSLTPNNLVSGDYLLHAIQGNGTDKWMATNFSPSGDGGLTVTDQCYGAFTLGGAVTGVISTVTGIALSGTNLYAGYSGAGAAVGGSSATAINAEGYHIITANAAGNGVAYYHPLLETTGSDALSGTPSGDLELMRQFPFAANYINGRIGGYFAAHKLTASQARGIIMAREYLMGDVNEEARLHGSFGNRLVCFGDSVTSAGGASDEAHAYPALLAPLLSKTVIVRGNGGTLGAGTGATDGPKSVLSRCGQEAPAKIVYAYGLNDANADIGTSALTSAIEGFVTRMRRVCKLDAGDFVVSTQNFATFVGDGYQDRQPLYAQAERDGATGAGCHLADNYVAFGTAIGLLQDGFHPNDAGHILCAQTIADAFPPAVTISTSESTLERGQAGQTLHVTLTGATSSSAGDFTLTGGTVDSLSNGGATPILSVTAAPSTGTKTLTHTPSGAHSTLSVTDTIAPDSPAPSVGSIASYAFSLSWSAIAPAPSGETITYDVKKNGSTVSAAQSGTSYSVTGAVDGDVFSVLAKDNAGNASSAGSVTFHAPTGGGGGVFSVIGSFIIRAA